MDLTSKNFSPQKVLKKFDKLIYNVNSNRVSICYVDDGQIYIALFNVNNVKYIKKYEKSFYDVCSIDSNENNEIIYVESNGYYKTIHTIDANNSETIKFDPIIRFHYPLIFYEHEQNELWFQNIEEKSVIHRFLFVNKLSGIFQV